MATTPTKTPEIETIPATAQSTVRLPDSAVLRTVPPAVSPVPRSTYGWWIAITGPVVVLVAAIAVIAWQQTRVDDAARTVAEAQANVQVAAIETERLQAEVDSLDRALARAQTRTEGLERRVQRLEAQLSGSAAQGATLAQTQQELARTQAALATSQADEAAARAAAQDAHEELNAVAGVSLADGTWTGRLFMVGGTQLPPMLAFDERKLFRGQAAIDAMIADGIPAPTAEACGEDCTYWRNPSTGWRIMPIAGDAPVTLKTFSDGRLGPTTMGLVKFTRLFNGSAPQNAHLTSAPYRLTMSGGQVTAIEELTVTW